MVRGDMLQGNAARAVPSSAPLADGANAVAPARRRGLLTGALALTAILTVAGLLTVLRTRPAVATRPQGETAASRAVSPGGIGSSGAARAAAAAWVRQQVSRSVIVSCDPAMCLALRSGGFPGSSLLPLTAAAADPLGSTVIVATAALRNQLGPRLASVYAPVVIASFGSGAARVDIRAYGADSAARYRAALAADLAERRTAGRRLAANADVAATGPARRDLAAGRVDARLLITLAALATRHHLSIVAFGDGNPGGDARLPLRSAEIALPAGTWARGGYLRSVLAALRTPRLPRLPLLTASTRVTRAGAAAVLQIGFLAPTPLGLLK